jgi:uncharacterized protein (TIGR00725 family)
MARRPVIGVMGRGEGASPHDQALAEELGALLAARGWIVLCGGRDAGVMRAVSRGAKSIEGSLTVGVLPSTPDDRAGIAPDVDVAIFTGMGDARNAINVLSSDVVVICGAPGAGTASEAALALKARRPLVLLAASPEAAAFFPVLSNDVALADTPAEAVAIVGRMLSAR